jgi:hypothetical protein
MTGGWQNESLPIDIRHEKPARMLTISLSRATFGQG